jgi:hypothetical protein
MMQHNTALRTIELSLNAIVRQIYTDSIAPRLEMNIYTARIRAIKKADIALRRPLLGLALQTESVRNTTNLLWMFLSGNSDIVLQSNADDDQQAGAAGASLPVEAAASAPPKRKH